MASAKSAVFDYVTYKADEGTESLQRFNVIKNNTECIFAKTARLWGSQAWRDDVSLGTDNQVLYNAFLLIKERIGFFHANVNRFLNELL